MQTALFSALFSFTTAHCVELEQTHAEVLRLGDVAVTVADVDASAYGLPPHVRGGYFDHPKRLSNLIQGIAVRKIAYQEAIDQGIVSAEELEAIEAEQLRRLVGVYELRSQARSLTEPNYEEIARQNYEAQKHKLETPETVTVTHVLISTENRSLEEAQALAESVAEKARQDTPIARLVQNYSEDPSRGSNLGLLTFGRGEMVPAFDKAAWSATEEGEIIGPVKTGYGFHVIQFHKRNPPVQATFEEVEEEFVDAAKEQFDNGRRELVIGQYEDPEAELFRLGTLNNVKEHPMFDTELEQAVQEEVVKRYKDHLIDAQFGGAVDTLAKERYLTRKRDFATPEERTIRVYRISSEHVPIAELRDIADSLADRIKQGGDALPDQEELEALRVDVHEGMSLVKAEASPNDVEKAAMSLESVGQYAGPIRLLDSLYFIKLEDIKESQIPEYETIESKLKADIREKLGNSFWQDKIEAWKDQDFEANPELVASLRTRYYNFDG